MNPLRKVFDFLDQLEHRQIHYTLARYRTDALMVEIAVPGARWEVEFFADGHVEVEIFRSNGDGIVGEETLAELLAWEDD